MEDFHHNDLHMNNVLIYTLPSPLLFIYKIKQVSNNGEVTFISFEFKTTRLVKMIDYGRCTFKETNLLMDEIEQDCPEKACLDVYDNTFGGYEREQFAAKMRNCKQDPECTQQLTLERDAKRKKNFPFKCLNEKGFGVLHIVQRHPPLMERKDTSLLESFMTEEEQKIYFKDRDRLSIESYSYANRNGVPIMDQKELQVPYSKVLIYIMDKINSFPFSYLSLSFGLFGSLTIDGYNRRSMVFVPA
jgi:hypothetical protein